MSPLDEDRRNGPLNTPASKKGIKVGIRSKIVGNITCYVTSVSILSIDAQNFKLPAKLQMVHMNIFHLLSSSLQPLTERSLPCRLSPSRQRDRGTVDSSVAGGREIG